jgi:hypothetical protein
MKAFPTVTGAAGMDLRDYFAAKAMQGILANVDAMDISEAKFARWTYEIADAMMKARDENGE